MIVASVMTDVLIHSPFPRQVSQGNSTTADRLQKILLEAGMDVVVEEEWYSGVEAGCLVALNARRSAGAVVEFCDACPDARVVVLLTGTDINHPEMEDENSVTRRTMQLADSLVLLHEGALPLVPESLRGKCQVIHPSVQLPEGLEHDSRDEGVFEVIMAGNARREKNVPLVLAACDQLPGESKVVVRMYGDAEGDLAQQLLAATAGPSPFQWKGKTDHESLMRVMAGSDLLLNSSVQEGGANAVCEAVSLCLPVVASDIVGNVGMLGDGYEGYFPSGDVAGLVRLLLRAESDRGFYERLKSQVESRAVVFAWENELRMWEKVVNNS